MKHPSLPGKPKYRIAFTIALTLSISTICLSQNSAWYLSGAFGYSSTFETGDRAYFSKDYKPATFYGANVGIRFRAERVIALSVEPGFALKRNWYRSVHTNNPNYTLGQVSYLAFPLKAECHFHAKWYVSAGPVFEYLLRYVVIRNSSKTIRTMYEGRPYLSFTAGINYNISRHMSVGLYYGQTLISEKLMYSIAGESGLIKSYRNYLHLTMSYNLVRGE